MSKLSLIMNELGLALAGICQDLASFAPLLIWPAAILFICLTAIGIVNRDGKQGLKLNAVAASLAVMVAAAFATSIDNGFHFDDSHSVESNMAIRSMANIPSFWTDSRTSSFIPENRVYRPLVYTFYSVCWFIGKGAPWPFHVMKMFMHLMVALAIFLIWRRLWKTPGWYPVKGLKIKLPLMANEFVITSEMAAFLLAAVFAVHPATSECVVYVSATTSLQAAVFYVWAFYQYLLFRDSGDKKHMLVALALYFLSVASKEEGITLPAMVLVTEAFLNKGTLTERLRQGFPRFAPYAALGLLLTIWIFAMRPSSGDESRGYVSSFHYFITQWRAYVWYMRLWFWPWDLNADTAAMVYSKSIIDPLVIQAAIGNILVLALAWAVRHRTPAMLYGLIWFYVTIAPASSVVVLAEAINEHRMYLSYVGFIGGTFAVLLYFAELFSSSEFRAKQVGLVYTIALFGLVVGTQERNRVWQDGESLWTDTVEKNPTSGRAMNNLALVHMSRGDYSKAIELLESCERHWAGYHYCPLNKGLSFAGLASRAEGEKKPDEAKKYFELADQSYVRAFNLNPRSVHVNFQVGRWFEETRKDYARAVEFFYTAVRLTGDRFPEADIHLANSLMQLKRSGEARAALDRALAAEPDNQQALFAKGKLEFESGNSEGAIRTYKSLVDRNPRHVQGWYNLGVAQLAKQDLVGARSSFQATVHLDAASEQGWFNLAYVSERLGNKGEALEAARRVASIAPSNPVFQNRVKELERK